MKQWIKLWTSISLYLQATERSLIAATIACTLVAAGCMAISPFILGHLTDSLLATHGDNFDRITYLACAYLAVIATPRLATTLVLYLQSTLRLHANRSLLASYFNYLCEQPEHFFTSRNSGELSQEITQASNDLYVIIRNFSSSIVAPIVQIGIAIAVLAVNRNGLVAATLTLYIALFLANNVVQGRRLVKLKTGFMEAGRKSYATLTDSIANIQIARQFDGYQILLGRYTNVLDEDRLAQARYWKVSAQMQSINAMLFVSLFGVSFTVALLDVVHAQGSVGNFVLVGAYTLTLLSPIESLGNMFTEINQSLRTFGQFVDKLSSTQHRASSRTAAIIPQPTRPAIEFEHVSLTYPGTVTAALNDVSFTVAPGQRIIITGPSGAGKSSIVKALTKQYTPNHGSIRLFGQDLEFVDAKTLCDTIGNVSQDVFTFKDTLRFNLQIARPSASDDELLHALRSAGLGDFVSTLPDGLETRLGDRGSTLSGGQRQRLALARLLLRSPDIIIIDEGTSSLDVITEKKVLDNMLSAFADKTVLIVTHRPSAIAFADTVIVVTGGHIDDCGTHHDVMSRNEYFSHVVGSSMR
ncbi:ABC transporter ATP-binding protein [Burkholderia ambifaria]|uniref:ABC transporter ATP-binding protein n=1 Tax=Burkholderia ambifaria TaxID=152480 RepID=UPI002FDFC414